MQIEKQVQPLNPKQGDNAHVVKQTAPLHTLLLQIKDTLLILDKALTNKQTRTISKLTKQVRKYRNVICAHHIMAIMEVLGWEYDKNIIISLKSYNAQFNEKFDINRLFCNKIYKVIELQSFIKILFIEILWQQKKWSLCLQMVNDQLGRIITANKRSLDHYSAQLYGIFARVHEKLGTQLSIRQILLDAYNRTCVRMDEIGQSTLINLLLRNYLKYNNIDAAYNLIEKTSFPENKSNNQFCKYLYYTGKVKTVRRQYSDALSRLNQAIRKSPEKVKGFKIHCQKIAIVVQLLLGQIPNRQIFADEIIFANAYAYYRLVQVVLQGQLGSFNRLVEQYRVIFEHDKLYTIILRLNQIVIRIGLRKIYMSYSKISLNDISKKLNISHQDVEFIVAKALRDGIMNGQIDHEEQILIIEGDRNLYVTNEPQITLNKRIRYCLSLYHETQKAITYPDIKLKVEKNKEGQVDASQLLGLLQLDED